MRRWNLVRAGLGGLAGFAGAGAWAVSLSIYQHLMEPADSGIAENNTYWPRDVRELGILLGVAAVLAIAGVTRWTLAVAGLLGVGWLGVDLWLDRVDFFDPGAVARLTAAGCGAIILAGVLAALVSRPSARGHYVVAATVAVLSTATGSITHPWLDLVGADIPLGHAVAALDLVLRVAAILLTVALLPASANPRARWLVPVGVVVALASTLSLLPTFGAAEFDHYAVVGTGGWRFQLAALALLAALTATLAGSLIRQAVIVGASAIALFFPGILVWFTLGRSLGTALTRLAGNPPVNGADSDIAIALSFAVLGLLIGYLGLGIARALSVDLDADPRPAAAAPPAAASATASVALRPAPRSL